MTEYCKNKNQATINLIHQAKKEVILSKNPPVEVVIRETSKSYIDFFHNMTAPIDRVFEENITDVELLNPNEKWQWDPNPVNSTFCPTLTFVAYDDTLHIEGRRLYCYFDSEDPQYEITYGNNSGVCKYRVYFGGCQLIISDTTGTIFEQTYQDKCPSFNIACDDECPSGTTKCFSTNYPGYCCLPCSEIAEEIKAIANLVRSLNNG